MRISVAIVAALAMSVPTTAQMKSTAAPTDCPAKGAASPELEGWTMRSPLTAAGEPMALQAAEVSVDGGVDLTLMRATSVHYAAPPEKSGGSSSYGGLIAFTIAEAGTYRIALGAGAWIDVLKDGKAVTSSAHGHGPACSGIRKIVDFPLSPGRYILQIAASTDPDLPLLLSRVS